MSTTAEDALKTAVQAAIDSLRAQFDHVRVVPDGQGGAWVEIDELALSPVYAQPSTSMICLLPFNLPNADVYPVFVRADLGRADGAPLGEGFQLTQVQLPGEPSARPAVQVSRRTRESQVVVQTAAQKLEKVLLWMRTR